MVDRIMTIAGVWFLVVINYLLIKLSIPIFSTHIFEGLIVISAIVIMNLLIFAMWWETTTSYKNDYSVWGTIKRKFHKVKSGIKAKFMV